MNAKNIAAAALGAVVAIALSMAWFNHHAAQEAKAALILLASREASLRARIRSVDERIAAATIRNQEIRSAKAEPSPRIPAVGQAARITPRMNPGALLALLTSNPKLYAMGMKVVRANMSSNFGRMFRTLNLTPDQIEKFENLALQHQEAQIDILSTANAQGVQPNDPAVATLMQQENTQYQTQEQALLGDSTFQQLQQFNRTQPIMGVVGQVASAVALTETPLSTAQSDQLAQILANASSQYQSGGTATPATINWPAALGQAQGILSPTQYTALEGTYAGIQVSQYKAQFDAQEKAAK